MNYPQKIINWAHGIAEWEGAKPEHNNPGNLKVSTLTLSWGIEPAMNATDGGNIGHFKDYQTGFNALCNFLMLGCENELKAFHQARTFEAFTKIYAGNPPLSYIIGVASHIPTALDTDIATFLNDIPKVPESPLSTPTSTSNVPHNVVYVTPIANTVVVEKKPWWLSFFNLLASLFHK